MKKNRVITIASCLLISIILFTSCESPTPSGLTDSDKEYFQSVTTNAYESWNSGDREPYVNRYSPDAIFMAPNLETLNGRDAIQEFAISYPEIHLEFPIVEIFGTAGHVNIRGTYVITDPDGTFMDKGKYLSVWQKSTDGNWQLTHDIYNSDLPIAVAAEEEESADE